MIIRVYKNCDDIGPLCIGVVEDENADSADELIGIIEEAWGEFQKTEPNDDAAFIDFLCEHYGFSAVNDENEFDVFLG